MTFQSYVNLACNYYPLLKPHVEASGGDDLALVERLNSLGPSEHGFNLYQSYLSADAATKVSFDVWSLEEVREVLLQYKASPLLRELSRDEYWAMYDIKVPSYQFPEELFVTLNDHDIGVNALNYQRAMLDNLLVDVRSESWVQQTGAVDHDQWLWLRPQLSRMLQQLVENKEDEIHNLQNAFTVLEENPDVYTVTLTSVAQGLVDLGTRVEAWKRDVVTKLSSFEFWQKAFPFLFGGGRATAGTEPYFDSTPSETIMPEDKSYTPIPDEKLRRTNPKRYDARHDWYSENNQFGDTSVSNRYDNPPPTVSSLKFAFDLDYTFQVKDRVMLHNDLSNGLGTVVDLLPATSDGNMYRVVLDNGGIFTGFEQELSHVPLITFPVSSRVMIGGDPTQVGLVVRVEFRPNDPTYPGMWYYIVLDGTFNDLAMPADQVSATPKEAKLAFDLGNKYQEGDRVYIHHDPERPGTITRVMIMINDVNVYDILADGGDEYTLIEWELDPAPPKTASKRLAFDVDANFEEGDRVWIYHNRKRLGTVVGWSVSNVHKHYDVRGDDGKMYSLYTSEMTRDFGERLSFETSKYNIGQRVWVINTGFWYGNREAHYLILIKHIYIVGSPKHRYAIERIQKRMQMTLPDVYNNMPLYESTIGSLHWENELEPLHKDKHYYSSLKLSFDSTEELPGRLPGLRYVGTDDWLIFVEDQFGHKMAVSTETWPEWLDVPETERDIPNTVENYMVPALKKRLQDGTHIEWIPVAPGEGFYSKYTSLEEIDWEINRTVEACHHLQKNSSIFDNEYYAAWSQDFIEKLLVRHELAHREVAV